MAFKYSAEDYDRDCRHPIPVSAPELSAGDLGFLLWIFAISVLGSAPIAITVARHSPEAGGVLWVGLIVTHVGFYWHKLRHDTKTKMAGRCR